MVAELCLSQTEIMGVERIRIPAGAVSYHCGKKICVVAGANQVEHYLTSRGFEPSFRLTTITRRLALIIGHKLPLP